MRRKGKENFTRYVVIVKLMSAMETWRSFDRVLMAGKYTLADKGDNRPMNEIVETMSFRCKTVNMVNGGSSSLLSSTGCRASFPDTLSFRPVVLLSEMFESCCSTMVSEGWAGVGVGSFGSMVLIYVFGPLGNEFLEL